MSDNLLLYGPGGASPVNLGSWLRADPGPDFGARGLVQAIEAESFGDGGQFVYDRAGIRHMGFPLRPASGGAGLSLTGLESLLRLNARPGGYLDVQPEGTPSSEAVRFDVVHGRWEPDYSIPMQRAARRDGNLLLDTQPYGYWPTWITLASVSGQAAPFRFPIRAASVIGDVPAFAKLMFQASSPALACGPGGSWVVDTAVWSIGGGPSFPASPMLLGASFISDMGGNAAVAYVQDAFASQLAGGPTVARLSFLSVGSQGFGVQFGTTYAYYAANLRYSLPNLDRYRGRHRVFMWAKLSASSAGRVPFRAFVDTYFGDKLQYAATAAPVATIIPNWASNNALDLGYTPWGPAASSAYTMYDLGEISVPPAAASGFETLASAGIRLFIATPSNGAATTNLDVAGMMLHPVDGLSGAIPRGMYQPTIGAPIASTGALAVSRLDLDSSRRSWALKLLNANLDPDGVPPAVDAMGLHRGGLPYLGASDTNLNVMVESRLSAASTAETPIHATKGHVVDWSLAYRPRFAFLRGL